MRRLHVLGWALALLCAYGCSSSDQGPGTRSGGDGDKGGDGDFGNPGGDGDGDFGNGNGTGGTGGGTGGVYDPGETITVEGSFIWIANSEEGTVSKIDTRTLEELGRYLANPGGDGHPSRTSVGGTGAVVVANRGGGFDFGGLAGTGAGVTKIEASKDLCHDRNGNGTIDTSTGANDIKPWMEDECISWWTPIDAFSNRPVSWAPPAGPDLPEKVWTSGSRNCTETDCNITVYRLNGDTGAVEDTVNVGPLSGVSFIPFVLTNYGAYGGASDGGGHFWGFVANTGHLFRVDALTLAVATWPIPNPTANAYGITVDPKGRVFLCGTTGLARFDPTTQTWAETVGSHGFVGCMTDGAQRIWVGGDGLHEYDVESLQLLNTFPTGGGVKGVSVDFDNKIWGVGGGMLGTGDRAFRLDPTNGQVDTFVGLVGAYSYSDMTGFGLTKAGSVPVDPQ